MRRHFAPPVKEEWTRGGRGQKKKKRGNEFIRLMATAGRTRASAGTATTSATTAVMMGLDNGTEGLLQDAGGARGRVARRIVARKTAKETTPKHPQIAGA